MKVLGWGSPLVPALALVVLGASCSDPKDETAPAATMQAGTSSAPQGGAPSPFGNPTGDAGVQPTAGGSTSGGEQCGDGLDNDADSATDEDCTCTGGAMQQCYGGPAEQAGVGACARGLQRCQSSNEFASWGPCTDWVPAGDEQCNTLDDDCDGQVDENLPETVETCGDDLDNDCDGDTDENCECMDGTTVSPATGGDRADILILDRSVSGGASSQEAMAAEARGYTVEVVDDTTWSAMTTNEFASYKAIVLGDTNCEFTQPGAPVTRLAAASANTAIWGAAVTGNVIIIGTDQTLHAVPGGQPLNEDGIDFAASREGRTGAFVSLGCDYHGATPGTPVPYLDGLGMGFTIGATPTECFNNAYIVATHPALANVTNESLSNWSCSVHEMFESWPSNYEVLAIARFEGGLFTAADGTQGTPYILARGVIPKGCGDGEMQSAEECDDGNNVSGDGCDEACNVEVCGDRVQQAAEACDDGNTTNGDGCSDACQIEPCFVAECGDGILQRGEDCDNGEDNSDTAADACRTSCLRPRCGDGIIDSRETCDDGPANSSTGTCRLNCTTRGCGDGIVDGLESCDDGNTIDGDGCDADCTVTCSEFTADVRTHEMEGRAYSAMTGTWPLETTTWYAQGSNIDLGTNGSASVTLFSPYGSGLWYLGSCP